MVMTDRSKRLQTHLSAGTVANIRRRPSVALHWCNPEPRTAASLKEPLRPRTIRKAPFCPRTPTQGGRAPRTPCVGHQLGGRKRTHVRRYAIVVYLRRARRGSPATTQTASPSQVRTPAYDQTWIIMLHLVDRLTTGGLRRVLIFPETDGVEAEKPKVSFIVARERPLADMGEGRTSIAQGTELQLERKMGSLRPGLGQNVSTRTGRPAVPPSSHIQGDRQATVAAGKELRRCLSTSSIYLFSDPTFWPAAGRHSYKKRR
ncbi:hypothetical protein BC628DRAFT_40358 [Trametes gibbosa]|nr:hypothetical protein BC628DRAFT_40358 [Trametes gibbosa]